MMKSIVKIGAKLVTGIGVSTAISAYISPVKESAGTFKKVCLTASSVAIAGAVVSVTDKYVDEKVDQIFNAYSMLKDVENIIGKKKNSEEESEEPEEEPQETKSQKTKKKLVS